MDTWSSLLDLGLGRRCLDCGAPGRSWCPTCLRRTHQPHLVRTPGGRLVHAAASYDGGVRSAILAHKEQGQLSLARPLGRLLAPSIGDALAGTGAHVVAAPSGRSAVRRRGHDHAHRLAREGAAWWRGESPGAVLELLPRVLSWRRKVADQGGLDAARRATNVVGAMCAGPPPAPGSPVLLVDDIVTTGATLDEASRALEDAGWQVLGAAVVASVSTRWGVARTRRLG
jgi:predicted amidophosphoribosyltransferase